MLRICRLLIVILSKVLLISSEKLAAIEARKERMREIRAQLVRSVVHQPPDMDETYVKAKQQLKYIFLKKISRFVRTAIKHKDAITHLVK